MNYHFLLASLPHLPHFDRIKALPIGQAQLAQRLALLSAPDQALLAQVRRRLWPWRQEFAAIPPQDIALRRTAAAIIAEQDDIRHGFALARAQRLGRAVAMPAHVPAWLSLAQQLLESGDAIALERLRLERLWRRLDALANDHACDIEAVLIVVCRWDIANQWFAGDGAKARTRLHALAADVHERAEAA